MFRVAATSSNNSLLSAPEIKPLDQTPSHQSFWQNTANFAKNTFHTVSKYFLKGALINAVVLTPLEGLILNWGLGIKEEGTVLDLFQRIDQVCEFALSSTPFFPFIAYGITVIALPIFEELIHRAIIQNGIKKLSKHLLSKNVSFQKEGKDETYASKISKILGSVFFGYTHYILGCGTYGMSFIPSISVGLSSYFMESSAYEKDGLAGSIGMHMGNNAMCGVWDCVTILRRRYFSIG